MGTSRNDASPPTPPWKPVLAVLGRKDVLPERQSREIWLAAAADRGDFLLRDLSHPSLADACSLVSKTLPVEQATAAFDHSTRYTADAGLAVDIAKRALVRTIATGGNTRIFAAELFAETVSYYASRDLPSFVAAPGRIPNVAAAIQLKEELRTIARKAAFRTGEPPSDHKGWRSYVARVLSALQRPKVIG